MGCRIRDLDVYCEIVGEGIPIVMVHGMGVDHKTMRGCMEPVFQGRRDKWKRVYFDLPGMGNTKGADWINNSDDMFKFVLEVIDEVIPGEPFLIVGESYGGYLVRAVVHERPKDVEGMLLICPMVVADDKQRDVAPRSVLRRDPALKERLKHKEKVYLNMFLVDQSEGNWERFRDEMLIGFESGENEFKSKIRNKVAAYMFSFDVDELPIPFTKPSMIFTGRQDCLVGYRDHWKLVDNYPRSTFVVLDKAGHGLQIDQAELFNAMVNEWLDRVKSEQMVKPPLTI